MAVQAMIAVECRLAYDLHLCTGLVCSRQGGDAVCGACIGDSDAPAMGFRRKDAVDMRRNGVSRSLSAVGAISATPAPLSYHASRPASYGPFEE